MGIRQSALQRLKRNSISVKDIASQAWCEKQMELYILTPMPQTAAMEKGAAFHETRKVEVFMPLSVEPITWPDKFYRTAYENYTSLSSLKEKGSCRELKLYGSMNGFKVSGQLDELRMENGNVMVVEDKTVMNANGFSSARTKADTIQVSLYRKMLGDIKSGGYTFDNFAAAYSLETMSMSQEFLDGLQSIGVKKDLQTVRAMYKKMFEEILLMPEISDVLELRYFDRSTKQMVSNMKINYDKQALDEWLRYSMKYWSGEREAQPVSEAEKWKCNICRFFGKECTAWYNK
jgi:hypothetical protein